MLCGLRRAGNSTDTFTSAFKVRYFRKTFDLYDVDGRGLEMSDLASYIRQISGKVCVSMAVLIIRLRAVVRLHYYTLES
jgi:hypothetical protein